MITRAFCRCNSGHYFTGECCPFDGWSSRASKELTLAVKRVIEANKKVSLAELRHAGISDATLLRTIVIEFGSEDSALEAISPEAVVAHGEVVAQRDLDANLT